MKKTQPNSSKIVVGLDIGTTKICAIVGVQNENGKINVMGIGKAPSLGGVTEGMVNNIQKTATAIQEAISQAETASNSTIGSVYVGIAGRHIRSFTQSNSQYRDEPKQEITENELENLRKQMYKISTAPGTKVLHVLPQDYRVDDNYSDFPVGMTGTKLDINYHIITGNVSAAENITRCVERCGLNVEDVVVEPIASAKAVLTEEEMEAGVAILDIGGGTSDLAIFYGGRIRHTTVIPIGGQRITKDISEAFQILESAAEKMKVTYGNAYPENIPLNEVISVPGINGRQPKQVLMKNLSLVIHARLEELFQKVNYEIKNSGYGSKLAAGLVLTGGGAELKNISQLLEFITGHKVIIGLPNQHLMAKGIVSEAKSPMYATGAGLVIYGMEKEGQPIGTAHKQNTIKIQKTKEKEKDSEKTPSGGNRIVGTFFGFTGSLKNWFKEGADDSEDFIG
jgi:cell division protein FtsA